MQRLRSVDGKTDGDTINTAVQITRIIGKSYDGIISVGIGSGNEGHVQYGNTITIFSFNVFAWWNDIYNNHKRNDCEVIE